MTPATFMAAETAECPAAAARFLDGPGGAEAARVARDLAGRSFPVVAVCGRGSSGHAGVHLRYLIETALGIPVSATAPSIVTAYRRPPVLRGALFVVISQSGRSPDLVAATRAAREAGALTLALVNDPGSPVAEAAERVVPIDAGPERAVAATKTVVNSLVAGALLVARWTGDAPLEAAVRGLPDRLARAAELDWSAWGLRLAGASTAYVTARGHGLGPAREIALKLAETARLPALAFSAAELRHGPRAAVGPRTPVLALRQADGVADSVDALVADLRAAALPVEASGGPHGTLPWIGDGHPACDPIAMLLPAYRQIEREARRRGLDPDAPEGLAKITETL